MTTPVYDPAGYTMPVIEGHRLLDDGVQAWAEPYELFENWLDREGLADEFFGATGHGELAVTAEIVRRYALECAGAAAVVRLDI